MFQDGSTTFYRRFGNPTSAAAARLIADLEGAEEGIVFGSGMGAISTSLLAILRAGDHVIASQEIFAQTTHDPGLHSARTMGSKPNSWMRAVRQHHLADPAEHAAHLRRDAIQSAAADRGHRRHREGAEARHRAVCRRARSAAPLCRSPLALGATLSLHSATKFLGGHSDVLGGAASGRRELIARIRDMQILLGTVLDPHAAWLLMRGIRTLGVRVRRQAETALALRATARIARRRRVGVLSISRDRSRLPDRVTANARWRRRRVVRRQGRYGRRAAICRCARSSFRSPPASAASRRSSSCRTIWISAAKAARTATQTIVVRRHDPDVRRPGGRHRSLGGSRAGAPVASAAKDLARSATATSFARQDDFGDAYAWRLRRRCRLLRRCDGFGRHLLHGRREALHVQRAHAGRERDELPAPAQALLPDRGAAARVRLAPAARPRLAAGSPPPRRLRPAR